VESWRNTAVQDVIKAHSWDELGERMPRSDLIINATPVGMHPKADQMPVSEELIRTIPAGTVVYDLIYAPRPTLFLEKARQRGAIIVDGLEMLVQQGAKALEIWLGQAVPVDIMREALLRQSAAGAGGKGM